MKKVRKKYCIISKNAIQYKHDLFRQILTIREGNKREGKMWSKRTHNNKTIIAAVIRRSMSIVPAGLGILVLGCAVMTALEGNNVYAEDATDTKSLEFSVTSEKSIGITLSDSSVALSIQPTATGQFGRSSMTVNVSTNNTTGYNLTMQANTDTLTRSAQVNNTSFYINPISQSITCSTETDSSCTGWTSSYANNQWGYRIDSGTSYTSMTSAVSSAQSIKTTSAAANTSNTTVYFGAKLDNSIPTGSYAGVTLTFIATTNPVPLVIGDVTYLQDLYGISDADKTTLLTSMTENQAYSLKDNRDEQSYYVAKLVDGNIWFLDNLRLDLTNSTTKTNMTSATTNATDTSLNCLTGRTTGCASPYTTAADVDWTSSYSYTAAMSSATYATTIDSNSSNNWGNGSHMYGVYYNYCAASAGSYCYAGGSGTGDASEDVCPAGWRMPTGNSTGEWGALDSLINNRTASASASIQARLSLPLSGRFYNGSAGGQGSNGYWWSSTRDNGRGMYYFYADATYTGAANGDDRGDGYSMRCLFSAS